MHSSAEKTAHCCRQETCSEIQRAMEPITGSTAHVKRNLLNIISQGRQMRQSGSHGYCVHFLHQAAESFFVPEDIGEVG